MTTFTRTTCLAVFLIVTLSTLGCNKNEIINSCSEESGRSLSDRKSDEDCAWMFGEEDEDETSLFSYDDEESKEISVGEKSLAWSEEPLIKLHESPDFAEREAERYARRFTESPHDGEDLRQAYYWYQRAGYSEIKAKYFCKDACDRAGVDCSESPYVPVAAQKGSQP